MSVRIAPHLSRAELKKIIKYDPDTGAFFRWRAKEWRPTGFMQNGYLVILADKQYRKAELTAWLYMTGAKVDDVFFVNGDTNDFRWCNLARPSRRNG